MGAGEHHVDQLQDRRHRSHRHGLQAREGAELVTPFVSSHTASAISNTSAGIHCSHVTDELQLPFPPRSPARWIGRTITSKADAKTPSQAMAAGMSRPRRKSQAKIVLPTAKKNSASWPGMASMTRQVSASSARSASTTRVNA